MLLLISQSFLIDQQQAFLKTNQPTNQKGRRITFVLQRSHYTFLVAKKYGKKAHLPGVREYMNSCFAFYIRRFGQMAEPGGGREGSRALVDGRVPAVQLQDLE